jgi:hypothetical protein
MTRLLDLPLSIAALGIAPALTIVTLPPLSQDSCPGCAVVIPDGVCCCCG